MFDTATREARYAACRAGGRFATLSTVGSRGYGTDNADSDWDFKGVYVAHNSKMFSLAGARPTLSLHEHADMTLYELGHFCKLAAAANPTVLEVLWAEEFESSVLGNMLRHNRDLFLSKRVLQTYGGYAKSQVKKALDGTGGSRGADHHKRRKFRLHTVRLLHSGAVALRDGRIPVKLDPLEVRWLNQVADLRDDQFEYVVDDQFEAINYVARRSSLPDLPDERGIDQLMYSIRQTMS